MIAAYLVAIAYVTCGQTADLTYADTFDADLRYPGRLAPAPGGGVYVSDQPTGRVLEYDSTGALVDTFDIPELPVGIAVHPDGRIIVSRRDGNVGIYDAAFNPLGLLDPTPSALSAPNGIAIHPVTGEIYVADSGDSRILVFNSSGVLDRYWGTEGEGDGAFLSPQTIAIDPALDHVIVADTNNWRVQVFDTAGDHQFNFGYRILYLPNKPEIAWFARSEGLAVDACGNIYVADALMGTVRIFDSEGVELDSNHAPAIAFGTNPGELRVPCDVTIDGSGRLYVASANNSAIEVFDVVCSMAMARQGNASPSQMFAVGRKEFAAPVSQRKRLSQLIRPDNPLDIINAMHHGQYQPDLDPNQDGVVDMADLQLVLESFGAATLDDFLGDNGQLLMSTNSFELPHVDLDVSNACGRCHSMDGLPAGGMLTAAGQENLCLSCHTAAALAMGKPIAGVDKGESHPRGVAADAGGVAGPDPSSELALHLDDGDIRCGTCHNPHNSDSGSPYLRGTIGDAGLCGECHLEANQWVNSGHSDGDSPAFNEPIGPSRQACVRCHSGLGFIDFAAGLPQAQQRTDKQVHSCFVCHAVHGSSADYILRIFDDVTLPGNYVLTDAGASATCMSCHNGRYSGPSQSLTPHHALGAVILEGINGVDFGNTSLTNSVHTFVAGCVDCHMAPSPSEGNPGADKVGGHSFNMDVHVAGDPDEGFENVANACNAAACHGDTGPLTTFNRTAFGDYDGLNGIQGVQDETQGLLDLVLAQIEAKGAVYLGSYPYWNLSGVDPSELTLVKNAIWNHDLIKEDGSLGIHNTDYTVGLLQLTYEQLAGVVVPGADLLYTPGAFISDECSPCLGDINDDNVVNVTDFAAFAASFDALSSDQDYNPCADLNHNGVVNVSDFTLFAASFDQPCP